MKKFTIPLMTFLFFGLVFSALPVYAAAGDSLIVTGGNGAPGSTGHTVDIILKNATSIRGLIFNLLDTAGSIEVTDVQTTPFSSHFHAYSTTTPSGAQKIMFIAYQTDVNKTLTAGRNAILTVTFNVKNDATGGTKAAITIDSLTVAKTASTSDAYSIKNGNFWLGEKGDVLYSGGSVDLFDVLRMINIVLNRQPPPTEYENWAGDLDDNGEINIIDILDALDLALMGPSSLPKTNAPVKQGSFVGTARVEIPTIESNAVGELEIPVRLSSSVPVYGIALSFHMPQYMQVKEAQKTVLSEGLMMRSRRSGDQYRLVMCSTTGKPIPAGEGILLKLLVQSNDSAQDENSLSITDAIAGGIDSSPIETFYQTSQFTDIRSPESFRLYQNSPNPFNMSTRFSFDVPQTQKGSVPVKLAIYNTQGQLVKVLEDRQRTAGHYSVLWDGRDSYGKFVASGVYFYKLKAGDIVLTKKLAVMK